VRRLVKVTDPQELPMTDLAAKTRSSTGTKIRVELMVDAELLLEAQRQISAETPDAAVDAALQRLVDQERAKRDAARARLQRMYDDGELNFSELDEPDELDT